MPLSYHITGLNARLFEKITGVTLHCLDCQTKDQPQTQSAKYALHKYFRAGCGVEENMYLPTRDTSQKEMSKLIFGLFSSPLGRNVKVEGENVR